MRQIGVYYNHYNNTNNTTNTNNISINLQNNYLEKQNIHQNINIQTSFEQQQNNKMFTPASSSSSCSTFSSSPSVSPNPYMSPPVLRKEMEQDWGDGENESNNVDVFVRMPKLEPEVLVEDNDDNNDVVFFPTKTTNESSEFNDKSPHHHIFLQPSLNSSSKFFNLSSDISSSSTSSGIWSSPTEQQPLLIFSDKISKKEILQNMKEKEEKTNKNGKTILKNIKKEKKEVGKEEVEMKPKRKYVRRKVKDLEEGKEVKEEKEGKLIKRRRRKNLPKEENLEKKIKEEIKKESLEIKAEIKEEIREKEEENIVEKENKLERRKKLENIVGKKNCKTSCKTGCKTGCKTSCKTSLKTNYKTSCKTSLKVRRKTNENVQNSDLNVLKGTIKRKIKSLELSGAVGETKQAHLMRLRKRKEEEKKKKNYKRSKLEDSEKLIIRRRKRKALLLANLKLSEISPDKRIGGERRSCRHPHISRKMVLFSSSSSASPSPSRAKLLPKPISKPPKPLNTPPSTIPTFTSQPSQFASNWRPMGLGVLKQLPLRRLPDSNEENVKQYFCFNSIRHKSESDVFIKLGDCVLVNSADFEEDIFVGRVLSIHYEPTERSLLLTLLWFYTGKQLPSLRLNNSGCSSNFEDNELFASKHLDIVNADSVQVEEEEIKGNLCRANQPDNSRASKKPGYSPKSLYYSVKQSSSRDS
uniref:BAH domain-containing protein n=1 Tax=Meloidogyne floridensis TaxID=298350 RepID=A0A915NN53_9BILA